MRAHELVLQRLESDLAAGTLSVGDRLPGERTLAEELSVSRSSVREAMRVLEAMGVVRTTVGSGPEAGAIVVADPVTSIGSALRLHAATKYLPIPDLVETRILLESWAVQEVAHRNPGPDFAEVDEVLGAMDNPELTPEEFFRLDATFHIAMSALAGNVVVAAMMAALRDSMHGYFMTVVPVVDDWSAVATNLRNEHRTIVGGVRRGHGAKAAEMVRAHIRGYFELTR